MSFMEAKRLRRMQSAALDALERNIERHKRALYRLIERGASPKCIEYRKKAIRHLMERRVALSGIDWGAKAEMEI